MKTIKKLTTLTVIALFAFVLFSCEKDNGGKKNENENNDELYRSILSKYVSSTVVPTYKALAEGALKMRTANVALKANLNDANVKAASDAWMEARIAWELSEAFLFGPVGEHALDIDGHIDSWPLELAAIEKTLAEEGLGLTGREAWKIDAEVIGFHVTEYLLYRDGKERSAADITQAELNYLTAATDALVWDCVLAYVAWVGESNVSTEMKTVFNENPDVVAHLNANPNFMNFSQRLTSATGYSSWKDALSEIMVGAAEIAGEVGATKIEAPYREKKTENVESWYSWHSLDDYTNNILSIQNAYLGGMDDGSRTSSESLSAYIKSIDADMDTKIQDKIKDSLSKIFSIGKGGLSFYEVVRDQVNKAEVDAAVIACIELQTLFDGLVDVIE